MPVTLGRSRRCGGACGRAACTVTNLARLGKRDAYLYLNGDFLDYYDNDLCKQSGSYYTPAEVVEQMVRLSEQALETRFDRPAGFADPEVWTVDPAMGTGTYLHEIINRVSTAVADQEGPGSVPAPVASLAERLVGFELREPSVSAAQ